MQDTLKSEVKQAATPGPWLSKIGDDDRSYHIVQASTGGLIAYTEDTFGFAEADRRNALLLAAAPELLAALKFTVSSLEAAGFTNATVRLAHDVIAKAEGK